jgi:FKBP-type peptidyl-prolyl cis-trans isomerase (trigger factor)
MALQRSFATAIAGIAVGSELKLQVLLPGKDQESDVSIKAISVPFTVSEVRSIASPTPEQLRLRAIWLAKRRSK